jgi:hypothetical protein
MSHPFLLVKLATWHVEKYFKFAAIKLIYNPNYTTL